MTKITIVAGLLLALLLPALLGLPLLQDNLRAVAIKRDHAERLTTWGAGDQTIESAAAVTNDDASPASGVPAADPCALLPWVADFPHLAPRPDHCAPSQSVDVWTARQAWLAGDVTTACTLWQRWDSWIDSWELLEQAAQAAAWVDLAALLTCLESWDFQDRDSFSFSRLAGRVSASYLRLGDALARDEAAAASVAHSATTAYAAADQWDLGRQQRGLSATARLLAAAGDVDGALALLQAQAADTTLEITVRYRLWLEFAGLAAGDPARAAIAQDAYDQARRLRPDQIEPYTGLATLYRNSRPEWSIAALQLGLDSPAGQLPANRRALLRLLGDMQRGQSAWEAAACAYRAALAQPIPNDTHRDALQQAADEMEAQLGRAAVCD